MKLWLLRPKSNNLPEDEYHNPWFPWYDKCFGFVVRAETELEARKIAQENAGDEKNNYRGSNVFGKKAWLDKTLSSCEELRENGEKGMIIKDYHSA